MVASANVLRPTTPAAVPHSRPTTTRASPLLRGWCHFTRLCNHLSDLCHFLLSVLAIVVAYTIYTDVEHRIAEAKLQIVVDIAACAEHYRLNYCDPSTRLPFVVDLCSGWQVCMERAPVVAIKTKILAETISESLYALSPTTMAVVSSLFTIGELAGR